MFEVNKGDVVRMQSFTHVQPDSSFTFKAKKGKVAVFLLLGEENKDGSDPLDLVKRMNEFGWVKDKSWDEKAKKDLAKPVVRHIGVGEE